MTRVLSWSLAIILAFATAADAQTFRGGISGRAIDSTGGVLPGVTVTATNNATGVARTTTTSDTGDFSLPDLALGVYSIEASLQGFQTVKTTVEVTVSRIASVDLKMGISQVAETVQVSAAAIQLDTVSTALSNVIQPKQVQDLPLNGRDFTKMLQLAPGVSATSSSVNGARTRGNNYQIDGADNNDAFQNVAAVNQGGVSGIAGTLLPIEAIDQFSVQSGGSAETGRNAGSTVNLVIKSGTNQLHGTTYYFNRNEALSANSPVAPAGSAKREIRNNQYGFSLGGPIVHNKTFFFSTLEIQKLNAGNSLTDTAPSDAWVQQATGLLRQFNVPVNPVSQGLLALWPSDSRTGPAVGNNFVSGDPNTYSSYNGIGKVDHTFNDVHSISARYFGGGGDQVAQINSPYRAYFQAVPSRMHNVSVVTTSVFTSHIVNQFVVGYNYFKQTFNSFDTSANPLSMGLNTGVSDPTLAGPPNITINGFAQVGGTQPLGRVDKTLQFTDSLSWQKGSHQIKVGGEARVAKLFIFYDSNKRGTFTFDGTVGPWAGSASSASSALKALADFMAGDVATGQIVLGNTHHNYFENTWDVYAQDAWSVAPKVTLNYGLRYTYPGVLGASDGDLTTFIPDRGMVSTDSLYPADKTDFSPRVGVTYTPSDSRRTVIRGAWGMYYDMLAVNFFTANTGFANGGALGVGNNPGGTSPVFSITQRRFAYAPNVPVFGTAAQPPYGAFGVDQDLKLPYLFNFNVNVEQQIGPNTIVQIGYVGSRGHRLALMRDINAPLPGPTALAQSRRPFYAQYPELAAINMLQSIGRSEYNSLQMSLIQNSWHGLSGRLNYTLGHAMDNGSEARNTLPMDSRNVDLDWGNSTFDVRHIISAGFTYNVPTAGESRLKDGWQFNVISTIQSGTPFNIITGTDASNTGDRQDRPNVVGDPFASLPSPTNPLFQYWINPAAFQAPPAGTFGNLARDAYYGPWFKTVDVSVFKTTKLAGNASIQLRAEIFNLFNWINWANPGATLSSSTSFGILNNTRNATNAPGIGAGEPFNMQLAAKLIF